MVILACWSIFGDARVFLDFPYLEFWRFWWVVPACDTLRVCIKLHLLFIYMKFSAIQNCLIADLIFNYHCLHDLEFPSLVCHANWHEFRLKLLRDLTFILKIKGQIHCCKSALIAVVSDLVYA